MDYTGGKQPPLQPGSTTVAAGVTPSGRSSDVGQLGNKPCVVSARTG